MNVCLSSVCSFPPSFNSLLQRGRGLSESSSDKCYANWGQLMAAHTAVLPWPRTQSSLPGAAGTKDGQGWWWMRAGKQTVRQERQKSIGNESSLAWLPVGQLITDLYNVFPLSSWVLLKIIFLTSDAFQEQAEVLASKLLTVSFICWTRGHSKQVFFMFCFNLADAFSVNYEPNSLFHCFNKCVDTDISNPTFPGQGHVSLETNWSCRTLLSYKCWTHWP